MTCENKKCSTAGCGGPGMCPGIALMLSIFVGIGITTLSGSTLFGWLVAVPLGISLILGLPQKIFTKLLGR
ncbi:MAG: hypothetical protein NWS71_00105 [Opitutales bacterium]|nr:hypothetical protein [Opitutales bacterium]MDP4884602.1 hypothetical protein [Opitutales bacterium]